MEYELIYCRLISVKIIGQKYRVLLRGQQR